MPNTNTNAKPQSPAEEWEELAAAMFREYISAPDGEAYAEIRHAIEYARRSIMPALTERDALRERVRELEGALLKWSHDGALQTFEDRERFRAAARAALRGQS